MIIQEMFAKNIARDIKGVIKVGQGEDANVRQELEEYVVTRELQKHFGEFFSAYKKGINGRTDAMGVWISGFFGSGKSHFLKILSYLLEDKTVDGKRAIDYFKEDNKISDSMVIADMQLAADTSTDVILFNIDSKSEMSGKQSKEAILPVFLKVFNEMQGFYGSNPHIADLERKLSDVGRFDEFKEKFEEENGIAWIEARHEFDFNQDEAVDVLVDMGIMSEDAARNWCEKAFTPYNMSPEEFCNMVKKYIDKKGPNHHVVFLVDEIGQYIGDDSQMMLSLQTITEDLGTKCNGKVWIIVTSQQDIDAVTKVKGNDFSKIQGRFDTKLSLSSANVDEVIQKRILEKNDVAEKTLSILYDDKETVLKNLIMFNDGIEKKLYSNRTNFAQIYPFVPYQSNLLGSVLTSIRMHGAAGKHLADGERSMLALYKESAMKLSNKEPGALVPFYIFYDALEMFIESSHSSVITKAMKNEYINPNHEEDCFNVNVLKALFMIKYVKEIKANVDNIASLMVSNIDDDRLELVKKVEDALKVLVSQTLVQKVNDEYVFLTHEEQEIERLIRQQNVDQNEVTGKISELIFDGLFDEKKYKYPKFSNRYAFPFNQIVDDRPYKGGSGYELDLKILTPNYDGGMDDVTLRFASNQTSCVIVALPEDRTFIDEIKATAQIEKFLRYDSTSGISKYEEIKTAKKSEMREHSNNAKIFLTEALKNADIYVRGDKLTTTAKDITTKINEALAKLVESVYHKLSYIDTAMSESEVKSLIKEDSKQIKMAIGTGTPNANAISDVRDYIAQATTKHFKTSMKSLMDRFTKAPYGFVEDDIKWLVAKLFKNGEISLYVNSEQISLFSKAADDIVRYITRKEHVNSLMMETREKPPIKAINSVKQIMKDLFGVSSVADDEDSLMKSFHGYANSLKAELDKFDIYYGTQPKYPGKSLVADGRKLMLTALSYKVSNEFFKEIYGAESDYLDFADDFSPLKSFFEGEQRGIFDKSLMFMEIYDASKSFIVDKSVETLADNIKDILKMKSPYGNIYKLPDLNDKFMKAYVTLLEDMLPPIAAEIDSAKQRVMDELSGKSFADEVKAGYLKLFAELNDKADRCNNIATLQNIKLEADALKIRLLNEIAEKVNTAVEPEDGGNNGEVVPTIPVKKYKTVSAKNVCASSTWQIETIEDIDKYLSDFRKKLVGSLEDDTIISIEF